jgi:hypothetical protein
MGASRSRDQIHGVITRSGWWCRIARLEPVHATGCVPATRSTSHTVGAQSSRAKIPLSAVGAQEDETILEVDFSGHGLDRFAHLDPTGLIMSWGIRERKSVVA